MTKDEALKLALEVLEEGVQGTRPLGVATLEAIATIKEALAQPEQEPVVFNTLASLKHKKTVGPIESAMSNTTQSQPETWEKFCDSNCVWTDHHPDCKLAEQKPVATLWQHGETGRTRITMPNDITDCDARWFKAADLYTTPPQRKPLTDEEREQIYNEWCSKWDEVSYDDLMLAVEAAHGIKGEA